MSNWPCPKHDSPNICCIECGEHLVKTLAGTLRGKLAERELELAKLREGLYVVLTIGGDCRNDPCGNCWELWGVFSSREAIEASLADVGGIDEQVKILGPVKLDAVVCMTDPAAPDAAT